MSLLHLTSCSQIHLSTNPPKRFHSTIYLQHPYFPSQIPFFTLNHIHHKNHIYLSTFHNEIQHSKHQLTAQSKSGSEPNSDTNPNSKSKEKPMNSKYGIIPKKPKRGPRSEAVAVEDFVRNSLEKTFTSIREKNPELFDDKDQIFKEEVTERTHFDNDNVSDDDMVVDEDDPNWPIDADVGWGTRASQYFEKYPIKNLIGEDGFEIDWEGEVDDSWVQEINCLEWETFAFHPSPLIVLVFERYNRASDNWKLLKEIEKALKVYWNAKDRLPPRAVKLDINIERDLAYALKVRECPQILFLRGQKILYREKELRSADELVHMIAYFYYKAKKPSWIDEADLCL